MRNLIIIITAVSLLMSCQSDKSSTDSATSETSAPAPIERTPSGQRVIKIDQPCNIFSMNEIEAAFGYDQPVVITSTEVKTDQANQCIYSADGDILHLIIHNTTPEKYEGDNEAYLKTIFKNYLRAGQQREGFEVIGNIPFQAGWTPSGVDYFGNSLDFVVNNHRMTIQYKSTKSDTTTIKDRAVALAGSLME